jgi:hypothetical protein
MMSKSLATVMVDLVASRSMRPISVQEELLREALEAYRAEYKELSDDWKTIDTKLQGTITVCGIFIAGIIALIKDFSPHASRDQRMLLISVSIILGLSVLSCIIALFVRAIPYVPEGSDLARLVDDIVEERSVSDEQIQNYIRDQIRLWQRPNADIALSNAAKAWLLLAGQTLLVFAIAFSVVLIGTVVL